MGVAREGRGSLSLYLGMLGKKFLEEKAEKTGKIFSIDRTQTGAHRLHGKLLKSSGISKKGGSDKTLTPLEIQR